MIQIKNKIWDIKKSNFVYLVEKNSDLWALNSLKIDEKILIKIKEVISEEKNIKLQFFLWEKHFENIFILYYSKKGNETLIEFLWKELPSLPNNLTICSNNDKNLLNIIDTCILSRYKFETYKSKKEESVLNIFIDKKQNKVVNERLSTLENIILARNLWETPACDLSPENFAKIIKKTKWKNTKVKVFSPKDIEKKWLGLLHAVWKWSANKPHMVILERIVDKKAPTFGFVWKWIVFDSGWLDIKTQMMYDMKDDMCWAAQVYAIMKELDEKKIKVNIIACIPMAENFVSAESYRPSDILTSYSWKTVNITNTDAEWRLILADGVSYLSKNYKIDNMMTIATLTWVALFALGYRYAGIMWTDRKVIDELLKKSKTDFEKYSEFPFDHYFVEKCKSEIADLDNWTKWIYSGSTMWGAFIYHFLDNNEKFTHIDIAWVANNTYEPYGLFAKWTTGFWVDSLSKMFLNM